MSREELEPQRAPQGRPNFGYRTARAGYLRTVLTPGEASSISARAASAVERRRAKALKALAQHQAAHERELAKIDRGRYMARSGTILDRLRKLHALGQDMRVLKLETEDLYETARRWLLLYVYAREREGRDLYEKQAFLTGFQLPWEKFGFTLHEVEYGSDRA